MKKVIVDEKEGRKWEIIKRGENDYTVNYFEYSLVAGDRLTRRLTEAHITRKMRLSTILKSMLHDERRKQNE